MFLRLVLITRGLKLFWPKVWLHLSIMLLCGLMQSWPDFLKQPTIQWCDRASLIFFKDEIFETISIPSFISITTFRKYFKFEKQITVFVGLLGNLERRFVLTINATFVSTRPVRFYDITHVHKKLIFCLKIVLKVEKKLWIPDQKC